MTLHIFKYTHLNIRNTTEKWHTFFYAPANVHTLRTVPPKERDKEFLERTNVDLFFMIELVLKIFHMETQGSDQNSGKAL